MPKRNKTLYSAQVIELPDHAQKYQTKVHTGFHTHLRICESCRHALIEMLQTELARMLAMDHKKSIAPTVGAIQWNLC